MGSRWLSHGISDPEDRGHTFSRDPDDGHISSFGTFNFNKNSSNTLTVSAAPISSGIHFKT